MNNSIYTLKVSDEYRELTTSMLGMMFIVIIFHLLMSGNDTLGFVGSLFNSSFSQMFTNVMLTVLAYYLIYKRIIDIH